MSLTICHCVGFATNVILRNTIVTILIVPASAGIYIVCVISQLCYRFAVLDIDDNSFDQEVDGLLTNTPSGTPNCWLRS